MADNKPPRTYSPVEVEFSPSVDPTAREFQEWIPVSDAIAFIEGPWTAHLSGRIANRLRDGSLLTGAGEKRCITEDGILVSRIVTIEPSAWFGVEHLDGAGHSIWEHSEFTNRRRPESGIGWITTNFYDVRFEWDALFRAFPELRNKFTRSVRSSATAGLVIPHLTAEPLERGGEEMTLGQSRTDAKLAELAASVASLTSPPPNNQSAAREGNGKKRPRLPDAKMEQFAKTLLETADSVPTERYAHDAIRAAFAQSHVPRDRFLEIFRAKRGHKSRGRSRA